MACAWPTRHGWHRRWLGETAARASGAAFLVSPVLAATAHAGGPFHAWKIPGKPSRLMNCQSLFGPTPRSSAAFPSGMRATAQSRQSEICSRVGRQRFTGHAPSLLLSQLLLSLLLLLLLLLLG
jgi:hypothetical protein